MWVKVYQLIELSIILTSSLLHPVISRPNGSPSEPRHIRDSLPFQLFTNQTPKDDIITEVISDGQPADAPVAGQIENFIENTMRCRKVPGLSVAVVQGERVILKKGFGKADLQANTAVNKDTQFCVGSVTKAFMATLLGILLEENESR